ncbi:unnamed protein product [Closterium sp. NIES-65]|nr:unnamed protein product [Closterium sp. NIES-65]
MYPNPSIKVLGNLQDSPKLLITTTTSGGAQQILPWIMFHRAIGVHYFILFVEGKASSPENVAIFESMESHPFPPSFPLPLSSPRPLAPTLLSSPPVPQGVTVVQRTKELEDQQAKSRVWNETWLAFFFYKPCNYELFVRQSLNMEMAIVFARSLNMEMAIVFARVLGVDWIFHVDTDELLYPAGTPDFSLQRLIHDLPSDVDLIVFPNYESVVETADVGDSFTEAAHGNPNYFLTYGNGKSGAKMQAHLRPNGAHRWHNYMKVPKEVKLMEAAVLHFTYTQFSDLSSLITISHPASPCSAPPLLTPSPPNREVKLMEAAVLHFTYTHFSDLTSRRDRCGCKPNSEDVKKCFMLDFDRLVRALHVSAAGVSHSIYTDSGAVEHLSHVAATPPPFLTCVYHCIHTDRGADVPMVGV